MLQTRGSRERSNFWIFFGVVLLYALVTRFLFASTKPFHHDESLHAYYSLKIARGEPHVYDGMLHGPLLYYIVGTFMFLFGGTDFVAHLAPSLFGTILVCLPLLLRRQIGDRAVLAVSALLAISPTLTYFARFLREDVFTSVWVIGTVFGIFLYHSTKKTWTAYFATAMLALHFTNKENSYLHTFVWTLALVIIYLQTRRDSTRPEHPQLVSPISPLTLAVNCICIFSTIFILFYSSFFRHPEGLWQGVWDGAYAKSLLYWWDQNQKRRIDGPFDYHLPILANYEFLLIPFAASAWYFSLRIAKETGKKVLKSSFFPFLVASLCLVIVTFFAPRIAFVSDVCSFSEVCPTSWTSDDTHFVHRVAKALHIGHSRHLLQIICYLWFGSSAFFALLYTRHQSHAFIWFWLTAALGIYSYVGEKVPWLTTYIVLPLVLIAGVEVARIFSNESAKIVKSLALCWLVFAVPFTIFKSIRVSFFDDANPIERLVFTQTTPAVSIVVDRLNAADAAVEQAGQKGIRVSMFGDATWPFAWYVQRYGSFNFIKPTAEQAADYDAFFVDTSTDLKELSTQYTKFSVFLLPLRHWWVPQPNPSISEIFKYFFWRVPYGGASAGVQGFGDTAVYYLERSDSGSPFASLGPVPLARPQASIP